MGLNKRATRLSVWFLISILSSGLLLSYASQGLLSKVSADPLVISNDQVKDTYLMYVKLKTNQGQGSRARRTAIRMSPRIRSARKRRLTE